MFLLDTDILIYSLKGIKTVVDNFRIHSLDPKAISVITYGELIYGAEKSQHRTRNMAKVRRLRELFPVLEVSSTIVETFGAIKADLSRDGIVIDDFDLLIGATAVVWGYCVVTNNEKHFSKIPNLPLENWTISSDKTP